MQKIKILVVPSDKSGVGKIRSLDPHIYLEKLYPEEFSIDIMYEVPYNDISFYEKYQIVAFHRSIGADFDSSLKLINTLKSKGIKTICDIDDYWMPGKEHPIHDIIKINKINLKIMSNLSASNYVTTTTKIYAEEIKKLNKKVFVFPNAIDPEDPQFNEPTLPSDRLRIGWLGGSSHLHDLELLDRSFDKLTSYKDKLQFVLCGFDTRGTVTEINPQTGEQKRRQILPHETVWAKYEKIFTQDYEIVSDKYKNYLLEYKQDPYEDELNESYIRAWTKPVTSYARNYSRFDVSLAPIKNTTFNIMKSQLKVIEAGFYKKAIIASDLGPYQIDLKHYNNNDGNAFLVKEQRNHSDWAKYIQAFMKNRNLVVDLGEKLYETVKDEYNLINVTKNRADFYKSIL
jgi:glycosyltransferase involved in cell wall biosynthesis